MSKYLMKYKGKYRLKPNLDKNTNDFPRDSNGSIDSSYDDIYIKCANGSQVYHFGRNVLVAYVPSIGRGHNILIKIAKELKLINSDTASRDYEMLYSTFESNRTIFDIFENDAEIEFKFLASNIDFVIKFLNPQTSGSDISPFSTRNLPKASYIIPNDCIEEYKKIIKDIPIGNKLIITHITNDFLNDILSKDKLYRTVDIKSDMRKKMLKGKEYIHSIGYWDKYIEYLGEKINEEKG